MAQNVHLWNWQMHILLLLPQQNWGQMLPLKLLQLHLYA